MSITIFGDSITNGASDYSGGGWTSRIWKLIAKDFSTDYGNGVIDSDHAVFELGIGGDTIIGISQRFESELATRLDVTNSQPSEMVVGIAVGVNDSRINEKSGEENVTYDEFVETYNDILARLNESGIEHVFLVGLTPCDELLTRPSPFTDNLDSYFNDRIKKYDDAVCELARNNNGHYVDVFAEFTGVIVEEGPQALLDDGLHPNDRGHQLIADSVYKVVKPILSSL
jgi:lysophospholipase L1-like esterase